MLPAAQQNTRPLTVQAAAGDEANPAMRPEAAGSPRAQAATRDAAANTPIPLPDPMASQPLPVHMHVAQAEIPQDIPTRRLQLADRCESALAAMIAPHAGEDEEFDLLDTIEEAGIAFDLLTDLCDEHGEDVVDLPALKAALCSNVSRLFESDELRVQDLDAGELCVVRNVAIAFGCNDLSEAAKREFAVVAAAFAQSLSLMNSVGLQRMSYTELLLASARCERFDSHSPFNTHIQVEIQRRIDARRREMEAAEQAPVAQPETIL